MQELPQAVSDVEMLRARHDTARRVIGDLSIDTAALVETVGALRAELAHREQRIRDLEQLVAALQEPERVSIENTSEEDKQ